MSGEFGSYAGGYLDTQVDTAACDLEAGRLATSRAWSPIFRELYPVVAAICRAEACDTSEAEAVIASTKALPALRSELDNLDQHFVPYMVEGREMVEADEEDLESLIRSCISSKSGDKSFALASEGAIWMAAIGSKSTSIGIAEAMMYGETAVDFLAEGETPIAAVLNLLVKVRGSAKQENVHV